jgi:hypothetical protein
MTVTITHTELLLNRIQQLIDALMSWHKARHQTNFERDYLLVEGKKYYKLIEEGSGVHAFIDKATGGLYKPASFRAPAKYVRYQLLDDASFQDCLTKADCHGGYLYIR